MSPDQISAVAAFVNILGKLSAWPFEMAIILVVVGPWVLAVLLAWLQSRRFEAMAQMYENNVQLVKQYAGVAEDLKDVVIMNTTAMTSIAGKIDSNQFCPAVRLRKTAQGVQL